MPKRVLTALSCGLALAFIGCDRLPSGPDGAFEPAFASHGHEYADVLNQGMAGVYVDNGAKLVRQANGLRMSVTVPTPAPGSYTYAPGTVAGFPEVFTLWAFIFNYPDNCTDPCDGDDLGMATGANGGVYHVGGHIGAGASMTIAGRIGVGEAPRAFAPLESPGTAEIHLALAPHGAYETSDLPNEFRVPAGSPVCNCWWVAFFK